MNKIAYLTHPSNPVEYKETLYHLGQRNLHGRTLYVGSQSDVIFASHFRPLRPLLLYTRLSSLLMTWGNFTLNVQIAEPTLTALTTLPKTRSIFVRFDRDATDG